MSIAIQANLFNFCGITTQFGALSQIFGNANMEIKSNGTIREVKPPCQRCGSEDTYYNGSDDVTPSILGNFGLRIRFGHYGCKD